MPETRKKSFVLYNNFFNQLLLLTIPERGELITAIFQYENCGKLTLELSPMVELLFSVIKDTLDRDREQYMRVCAANQENGKKGGRPKKQQKTEKTERFFEKPKKPDNDNGNDNENDIEKDIDSGIDNGRDSGNENESSQPPPDSDSAPTPSPAPQQKKAIKKFLLKKGVDGDYVDKRLERAFKYAPYKNVSVSELLLEWWRADQGRTAAKGTCVLPDYDDVKDKPIEDCDENEFFIKKLYHCMEHDTPK